MKARELKLPLWQDIIYMLLVLGAPIIITCMELFESHSSTLRLSFASIGSLLVVIIVAKKYVFNSALEKYKQEIFSLEHDYSISNGSDDLIIAKWVKCKVIIYAVNALTVLLSIVLLVIFVNAITDGLMAFKGAVLLILLFVVAGLVFKLLCYFYLGTKGDSNEEDN